MIQSVESLISETWRTISGGEKKDKKLQKFYLKRAIEYWEFSPEDINYSPYINIVDNQLRTAKRLSITYRKKPDLLNLLTDFSWITKAMGFSPSLVDDLINRNRLLDDEDRNDPTVADNDSRCDAARDRNKWSDSPARASARIADYFDGSRGIFENPDRPVYYYADRTGRTVTFTINSNSVQGVSPVVVLEAYLLFALERQKALPHHDQQ